MSTGFRPFARPELEDTVENVERLAHLLRIRVRPEVDRAVTVPFPGKHDTGVLVGDRDGDVREGLVVAQPDVERGPVPLDEVLLEVEASASVAVTITSSRRTRSTSWPMPARVSPDALKYVRTRARSDGLADVEDVVATVAKDVDTGVRPAVDATASGSRRLRPPS